MQLRAVLLVRRWQVGPFGKFAVMCLPPTVLVAAAGPGVDAAQPVVAVIWTVLGIGYPVALARRRRVTRRARVRSGRGPLLRVRRPGHGPR